MVTPINSLSIRCGTRRTTAKKKLSPCGDANDHADDRRRNSGFLLGIGSFCTVMPSNLKEKLNIRSSICIYSWIERSTDGGIESWNAVQ
ncbi:hypothetical protein ANTQUA_LOCUS236 [Anthophora quadrimaculata]